MFAEPVTIKVIISTISTILFFSFIGVGLVKLGKKQSS
jgi:hypothetical protein